MHVFLTSFLACPILSLSSFRNVFCNLYSHLPSYSVRTNCGSLYFCFNLLPFYFLFLLYSVPPVYHLTPSPSFIFLYSFFFSFSFWLYSFFLACCLLHPVFCGSPFLIYCYVINLLHYESFGIMVSLFFFLHVHIFLTPPLMFCPNSSLYQFSFFLQCFFPNLYTSFLFFFGFSCTTVYIFPLHLPRFHFFSYIH